MYIYIYLHKKNTLFLCFLFKKVMKYKNISKKAKNIFFKNWFFFLSTIIKKSLSSKKKIQGDTDTDDFICLLHVYHTIYINSILISLVDFEKKIIKRLIGNLKNAFWLFWLNEVGFMMNSFNYESRKVFSNI